MEKTIIFLKIIYIYKKNWKKKQMPNSGWWKTFTSKKKKNCPFMIWIGLIRESSSWVKVSVK